MRPRFIQIDLDLYADFDLAELVGAFGDEVYVLYSGDDHSRRSVRKPRYFARLELSGANSPPNEILRRFCSLIEGLPAPSAALWKKVRRRVFDIGFDSGDRQPPLAVAIDSKVFARIANLGATVAVTIYPLE